jgi:hypothetical protein
VGRQAAWQKVESWCGAHETSLGVTQLEPEKQIPLTRRFAATSPPSMGARFGGFVPIAQEEDQLATPLPHTWGRGRQSVCRPVKPCLRPAAGWQDRRRPTLGSVFEPGEGDSPEPAGKVELNPLTRRFAATSAPGERFGVAGPFGLLEQAPSTLHISPGAEVAAKRRVRGQFYPTNCVTPESVSGLGSGA